MIQNLEEIPLARLKAHPRNARTHARKQLRMIARSIERFGFLAPVLIDADNTILAGHARVEAAKLIGRESAPCRRIDHLSEADKRAYVLADNQLALLGRGGNFMIVDDAMKPEDAVSDAKRTQVTDWFDATLTGRLDDKENGVIVVVMQRLQVEDLAGHVLAKENYVHLNLPAIAEKDEDIPIGHGEVHRRKAGEALHPGLASLETLEKIKAEIGTFKFSAQYQQQPVPAEGEVIKWRWFRTYDQEPTRLEYDSHRAKLGHGDDRCCGL